MASYFKQLGFSNPPSPSIYLTGFPLEVSKDDIHELVSMNLTFEQCEDVHCTFDVVVMTEAHHDEGWCFINFGAVKDATLIREALHDRRLTQDPWLGCRLHANFAKHGSVDARDSTLKSRQPAELSPREQAYAREVAKAMVNFIEREGGEVPATSISQFYHLDPKYKSHIKSYGSLKNYVATVPALVFAGQLLPGGHQTIRLVADKGEHEDHVRMDAHHASPECQAGIAKVQARICDLLEGAQAAGTGMHGMVHVDELAAMYKALYGTDTLSYAGLRGLGFKSGTVLEMIEAMPELATEYVERELYVMGRAHVSSAGSGGAAAFHDDGHEYKRAHNDAANLKLPEDQIYELLAERSRAKRVHNFSAADAIQRELETYGVSMNDALLEWRADGRFKPWGGTPSPRTNATNDPPLPSCTIFVHGFSRATTKQTIETWARELLHGAFRFIVEADAAGPLKRSWCMLEFDNPAIAGRAIERLDGTNIDGNPVQVRYKDSPTHKYQKERNSLDVSNARDANGALCCVFFLQNQCNRGDTCAYSHNPPVRRSRSPPRASPATVPSSEDEEEDDEGSLEGEEMACRICYGESTPEMPLLIPCDCTGSMKYAHRECVEKWIEMKSKGDATTAQLGNICDLCNQPFNFDNNWAPGSSKPKGQAKKKESAKAKAKANKAKRVKSKQGPQRGEGGGFSAFSAFYSDSDSEEAEEDEQDEEGDEKEQHEDEAEEEEDDEEDDDRRALLSVAEKQVPRSLEDENEVHGEQDDEHYRRQSNGHGVPAFSTDQILSTVPPGVTLEHPGHENLYRLYYTEALKGDISTEIAAQMAAELSLSVWSSLVS